MEKPLPTVETELLMRLHRLTHKLSANPADARETIRIVRALTAGWIPTKGGRC